MIGNTEIDKYPFSNCKMSLEFIFYCKLQKVHSSFIP